VNLCFKLNTYIIIIQNHAQSQHHSRENSVNKDQPTTKTLNKKTRC